MENIIIKHISRTCYACPSQWEAEDDKGKYIYIRFRHGWLSLSVNDKRVFEENILEYDGLIEFDKVFEIIPFLKLAEDVKWDWYEREKAEDRKIIAVDFDGTIVEDNWPHIGCIIPRVKKYLIKQKEENNAYIILWTCRCGRKLEEAVEFCDKADIPIDRVNSNAPWILEDYPFEPRKIHFDEILDDKNKIL